VVNNQDSLLSNLTDDDPLRTYPQGLPDEMAEADLACSFQVRLPGLHPHHIGQWHLELKNLLAGDHPLAGWYGGGQTVEHRGLAGLGATGHEDVEARHDARVQEARGRAVIVPRTTSSSRWFARTPNFADVVVGVLR
jgi:hypothetical protein